MLGIQTSKKIGIGRHGAKLNVTPLIFGIDFSAVTTSSFNVRATIDTKNKDAEVTVEYGLTTEYGSEKPINEGTINGIIPITANLIL